MINPNSDTDSKSKTSRHLKILVVMVVLTALTVVLKLGFEHYNFLFPTILAVILIYFLRKYVTEKDYRNFFVILLVINFLCLLISDKIVYKFRKSHRYFWSEKPLELSHFKIRRNIKNDTTAIVHPIIVGKINRAYNYPPAILFTSDYIHSSWIFLILIFSLTNSIFLL